MIIRKESDKLINLTFNESMAKVMVDANGYLTVGLQSNQGAGLDISKPGEYELAHVAIKALEIASSEYSSKVNLLEITTEEQIKIVFAFQNIDLDKTLVNSIGGADVLVIGFVTFEYLEKLCDSLSPEKLVVFSRVGEITNSALVDKLGNEFGKGNILIEEKVNLKQSDFLGEDETVMQIFVLK